MPLNLTRKLLKGIHGVHVFTDRDCLNQCFLTQLRPPYSFRYHTKCPVFELGPPVNHKQPSKLLKRTNGNRLSVTDELVSEWGRRPTAHSLHFETREACRMQAGVKLGILPPYITLGPFFNPTEIFVGSLQLGVTQSCGPPRVVTTFHPQ